MKRRNFTIVALFVVALSLSKVSCCGKVESEVKHPILSGHRGTAIIAPENTMASIDSSILYGVEYAECDVCVSADSVFYILHDYSVDRTTNGTGRINDLHSSYIDTLDAGTWFGEEFAGLRVPRLQEVLRRAKEGGLKLTLDYRNGDLQALYDLLKSEGMLENCNFVMREEPYFAFRQIAPEVKTMQAYINGNSSLEADIAKWRPNVAVVRMDSITKSMVERLHAEDIQVLALSLKGNDPDTLGYAKAIELGIDIIATDRADYYAKKYKR
ncbi:MAG: glycerophosphodiester phosphodiesterase family protein [Rikenellaceae bacterium]